MVPVGSMVPETMMGMLPAQFAAKALDADQAGLDVAGVLAGFEQQESAPPEQPERLDAEVLDSSSKVTPPVTVMALVVGPIEPATKRGSAAESARRPGGRGGRTAVDLVGVAVEPVLASTSGVPPKELVSTMSRAGVVDRRAWMPCTTSGRVRTRFSLQPSRSGPPKSSAVR